MSDHREKIEWIQVKFEGEDEPSKITITYKNGVPNVTAMFWHTDPIVMMLAKYYPARNVKRTKHLKDLMSGIPNFARSPSVGHGFDHDNIYPGDVTGLWNHALHPKRNKKFRILCKRGPSPFTLGADTTWRKMVDDGAVDFREDDDQEDAPDFFYL